MPDKVGVVNFPGSNCEHDVVRALQTIGVAAELVWHGESNLLGFDRIVLPGGFAHGDYLRPGAIARFSPVMKAVTDFASSGGPVLGICNGFQVLAEAGLVPGALQKNKSLRFVCKPSIVVVANNTSALTVGLDLGAELSIPVNHFSGSYVCHEETLRELVDNDQIVLRYKDNPNGSLLDIAAVSNKEGNVVGLMPHPERAVSDLLGSTDGVQLLRAFCEFVGSGV